MTETSLILMSKASQMLVEATTIQKAKEFMDLALTAKDWAKRKDLGEEAILHCQRYALLAERRLGELLKATERHPPGPDKTDRSTRMTDPPPTLPELGITKNESSRAQRLADVPKEKFDEILSGEMTVSDAVREMKKEKVMSELEDISKKEIKRIEGVYDVIVIDPPWPMEKIERDVRPNQVGFDYPTMSISEIWHIKIPHARDCHIWIWTTHKYLPELFEIIHFRRWKYVCTFVWHKPGGFQPVGLPQYNAEFVIYCRLGHPVFIDTKAFPVCFNGKRGAHSEKPEEFYETIRRTTAGRRLDMFGRRKIEGFDSWGNQANG